MENNRWLAATGPKFSQPLQIRSKLRLALHAILQTFQVCLQLRGAVPRQRVNHPVTAALGLHQSARSEIGEMLGNLHLRFPEDFLEVADAERALGKEMEDPQPRPVAEALINLEEVHGSAATAPCAPLVDPALFLRETIGVLFTQLQIEVWAGDVLHLISICLHEYIVKLRLNFPGKGFPNAASALQPPGDPESASYRALVT